MANPNPVLIYVADDKIRSIPTKRVRVVLACSLVAVAPAVTTTGGV